MSQELTERSALDLAALIRGREVSALEVVDAHLERIGKHNAPLNAIVTLDPEGARAAASAHDANPSAGPLAGVPFTLKDCHATAGMRTTAGHPPLADYIPTEDGTIAARLKAAGGILLGKTNVAQLLADAQSTNPIFGRTSNPWDVSRTSGGSSGGAGAAVAAGLTPFDIGSDIGGSIRMPSAFCGIVGIKPSERRVSNFGHIPELPGNPRGARIMNAIGPMARDLGDLGLLLQLIQGPDGHDFDTSLPPADGLPGLPSVDLRHTRIAFATAMPPLPLAADSVAAITRLVADLDQAGAQIEEATPGIDVAAALNTRAALRRYAKLFTEPPEDRLPADDYFRALEERERVTSIWEAFLQRNLFICPVSMVNAFPHCARGDDLLVDSVPTSYDLVAGYVRLFNLTGHPAVTVPIGLDGDGLPIGIQIVGPYWSDARLLGLAAAIKEIAGEIGRPPLAMA